jgi:AraC-like DNA-binding protein
MASITQLSLLSHPYEEVVPVTGGRKEMKAAASFPGSVLIWAMGEGDYAKSQAAVEERPGGLALIAILPRAADITDDPDVIHAVQRCRPHGLLPYHAAPVARDLAQVLRRPPLDLAAEVTDYLAWRGLVVDRETTRLLRRIIELSAELRSITALSRSMYLSRRALGRRLLNRGLPVPSHWLQLARMLRLASRLQNSDASVFTIAYDSGYPDGFSVSNQMHRLIGYRPSQVREYLGWEWILEAWLKREADAGGLAPAAAREISHGSKSPAGPPPKLPRPRAGRPKRRRSVA